MHGANLSGVNLEDADFTDADLTDANLSGAILNRARFIGTTINGTNFTKSKLREARFIGVNNKMLSAEEKKPIRFDKADMTGAIIENSDLSGDQKTPRAIFIKTILNGLVCRKSMLQCAIFQKSILDHTTFQDVYLSYSLFEDLRAIDTIIMNRVQCIKVIINYFDIKNSKFIDTNWESAEIVDFILNSSVIKASSFKEAKITKWYSASTILCDVDFTSALLTQCYFCAPVAIKRKLPKQTLQLLKDTCTSYRALAKVEYTVYCLGWNLIFDFARISSCYFVGASDFLNPKLKTISGRFHSFSPNTKPSSQYLLDNPYLSDIAEDKIALIQYDTTVYEKLILISTNKSDRLCGGLSLIMEGAILGGFGGPIGIIAGAFSGFCGYVSVSEGILNEADRQNETSKGLTFMLGASFNKTQFSNVLFNGLNLADCRSLNNVSSTTRTDFQDCLMPSYRITQLLQNNGCRINSISSEGYARVWGANPDLNKEGNEMLKNFAINQVSGVVASAIGKIGAIIVGGVL